jgi:hypothetical protein
MKADVHEYCLLSQHGPRVPQDVPQLGRDVSRGGPGTSAAADLEMEPSPTNSASSNASHGLTPTSASGGRQSLTETEKLRKVLTELVDTERAYVTVRTSCVVHETHLTLSYFMNVTCPIQNDVEPTISYAMLQYQAYPGPAI